MASLDFDLLESAFNTGCMKRTAPARPTPLPTTASSTPTTSVAATTMSAAPAPSSSRRERERDDTTYNVYNSKNTLITADDVLAIMTNIGMPEYRIHNMRHFEEATTHRSYCRSQQSVASVTCPEGVVALRETAYEGLECLGDAIIQATVTHYLFERYPQKRADAGFTTKLRSKLVRTDSLAGLATSIGLNRFLLISDQEEERGGRTNLKNLEDIFEAFIGAIQLDQQRDYDDTARVFSVCYKFVVKCMEQYIDIPSKILIEDNFKDALMRYFQSTYNGAFPVYIMDTTGSSQHNNSDERMFYIIVRDPSGEIVGRGQARNKKQAEQYAAKAALQYYGVLHRI